MTAERHSVMQCERGEKWEQRVKGWRSWVAALGEASRVGHSGNADRRLGVRLSHLRFCWLFWSRDLGFLNGTALVSASCATPL